MLETEQGENSVTRTLFGHNTWANLKLLDFCEALSDEQLDTTLNGTYGSIRDTLLHFVRSEVTYVTRVNGRLPAETPAKDQFPGFALLKDTARWAGVELLQLALSARSDTLVEDRRPHLEVFERYKLSFLMVQVINHSTEHRTQISTTLTQLGLEPPDMTGWEYMIEMGEFQEIEKPVEG